MESDADEETVVAPQEVPEPKGEYLREAHPVAVPVMATVAAVRDFWVDSDQHSKDSLHKKPLLHLIVGSTPPWNMQKLSPKRIPEAGCSVSAVHPKDRFPSSTPLSKKKIALCGRNG